jgi:membrane-bound lytic murein transglycosylase A
MSVFEFSKSGSPFFRPENMVHQTINTNTHKAKSAPSNNKTMKRFLHLFLQFAIVGMLSACVSTPPSTELEISSTAVDDNGPLPDAIMQAKSRWTPVRWRELPGWTAADTAGMHDAWNAWLKSCEKPATAMANLCQEVRRLTIASVSEQRAWMMQKLQPYRVETHQGQSEGLLTSYYEPLLTASRTPRPGFSVPLYRPPAGMAGRSPWYTRQEMDTSPQVKAQLRGHEIAYVADPIDALILQIQGSGRVNMIESDGSRRMVRLAFAATNDQGYKSVGRWLLDQGGTRDVSKSKPCQ